MEDFFRTLTEWIIDLVGLRFGLLAAWGTALALIGLIVLAAYMVISWLR